MGMHLIEKPKDAPANSCFTREGKLTMNRKKSIVAVLLVAVLAAAGILIHRLAFAGETTTYRFAQIERGDLQSTVSATGTLSAVKTVTVGTQVSGQVSALLVDFNDRVKKGQLLARIDPTLAQQAVTDAQANLERAQAQALQAQRDYARNRELGTSGLVPRSEIESTQSSSEVARAGVKSAQIALERARQNLAYTNIYAPIDGVVVARNVDEGQTVAASLSAPELFKIANDLAQMQILALVGESDIARIAEGQSVEFTVQALQGQTFKGTVRQVRLESTTADNVVNYTVVVSVDNAGGKLLPGMTARVSFLTKSAENVLKVANAALRYKPTEEQLAELEKESARNEADSVAPPTPAARAGEVASTSLGAGAGATRERSATRKRGDRALGTLYYLDDNGKLAVARVRTGLNDGTETEVQGGNVTEGMKVIGGTTSPARTATTSTPFQPSGGSQQRRGPGGF
jgi:HlyD family secretion protein